MRCASESLRTLLPPPCHRPPPHSPPRTHRRAPGPPGATAPASRAPFLPWSAPPVDRGSSGVDDLRPLRSVTRVSPGPAREQRHEGPRPGGSARGPNETCRATHEASRTPNDGYRATHDTSRAANGSHRAAHDTSHAANGSHRATHDTSRAANGPC